MRNRSAQLPGFYFGLVFLFFTVASFQRHALLGLSIPIVVFSFAFIVRSLFAGYLEVSPDIGLEPEARRSNIASYVHGSALAW